MNNLKNIFEMGYGSIQFKIYYQWRM
jgi:hypothetical protein